MATLLDAFKEARVLLNESEVTPQIWTDSRLLRYTPKVHRELQLKLWTNSLPVIKEVSAVVDIAIGALNMGAGQPADLIEPVALGERPDGNTGLFTRMVELDFEDNIIQETELRFWAWREELIVFPGATTAREVQLRYRKGLTIPTAVGNAIGFIFGEMYMGPRLAAIAAGSLGNTTLKQELTADADAQIEDIVSANVKGMQNRPIKRRPYRRTGRSTNFIWS